MKKSLFLILIVFFAGLQNRALGASWDFLSAEPLFGPLIGDLREPHDGIIAQLSQSRFEGAVGQVIEFLQWNPGDVTHWGWGIEGASYIELDSLGNSIFPERVSDWYLGTYFSEKSGNLSNRLEFEHVSSHLGDELFYVTPRIIYSRESLRLTTSYDFSENFRLYGGPCYWTHLSPDSSDPRFFFHVGAEFYTPYFDFVFATHLRGYLTYDLKVLGEAGGVADQTFEAGLQWRWKKDSHQSLRAALLYYAGNSLYGQFYSVPENYLGLGVFFDP